MTNAVSNNIVEFPKHKIVRDPFQTSEEGQLRKTKSLEVFADTLTEEITENILMDFANSGLDVENDNFTKDFHFLVGVLTATIYRAMDLKHELHNFIDNRVKILKDGEEFDMNLGSTDSMEFNKIVEELDKID